MQAYHGIAEPDLVDAIVRLGLKWRIKSRYIDANCIGSGSRVWLVAKGVRVRRVTPQATPSAMRSLSRRSEANAETPSEAL